MNVAPSIRAAEPAEAEPPPARAPRRHGLDIVRAAAIAWVMLYHAMNLGLVPNPDPAFVPFGWMGVDLFFVLSGFLIASQLLRPWAEGSRPDYPRFFARRLLRTLPAYAAILLVYFLVPAAREWPDIQPFWQFATFTENLLFEPTAPKAFSHVWSLCVEEQFYLVFPAAVALLAWRPSARKTITVLALVLLFGIAIRSWLWLAHVAPSPFDSTAEPAGGAYMTFIYYPTWSRLDGLLAGIGAAAVKIYRPAAWAWLTARPNLLLAGGIGGIAAAILLFGTQIARLLAAAFGFPLLSAAIALVVAAASTDRALLGRYRIPGAAALASGAYSLYLSQKIAYHAVATLARGSASPAIRCWRRHWPRPWGSAPCSTGASSARSCACATGCKGRREAPSTSAPRPPPERHRPQHRPRSSA